MSLSWASVHAVAAVFHFTSLHVYGIWTEDQFSMFITYFTKAQVQSLNVYTCSIDEARKLAKFATDSAPIMMNLHDMKGNKDLLAESTPHLQGVIVDFHCYDGSENWMNQMLNASYTWLIYVDDWSDVNKLTYTHLNFLSDVVIANCTDDECRLFETYRIRMHHPLNFFELGTWSNSSLILGNKLRKYDLAGEKIIGGIFIFGFANVTGEPPDFEDRSFYPGAEPFTRYHIVLYRHLEVLLNCKVEIVRSASYGYPLPNGSYDGLVGDVANRKIDLGITPIEPRPGRAEVVSFMQSYWKIRMTFMLRQPRALGSFSALAHPLSPEVWTTLFIFMIILSMSYDAIQYVSSRGKSCYFEGFVVTVGAIAQQGLSADVGNTPTRTLSFFLLFLSLVLMTYYNAAIMNALLLPAPVSIRTLEQLLAPNSKVQPGLLNITYLVDNRSSHKYVLPNTVKAVKRTKNAIMELKPGIERVRESNFAFCAEDNLLYDEVQRTFDDAQKCDLSFIELLKPFGLSSPIAKTSPFKEVIARGLVYLQENGLVDREKKHWTPLAPQCFGSISFFYVSLEAVGISFTIYLIGVFGSLCILVAELWYYKSNVQKTARTKPLSNVDGWP